MLRGVLPTDTSLSHLTVAPHYRTTPAIGSEGSVVAAGSVLKPVQEDSRRPSKPLGRKYKICIERVAGDSEVNMLLMGSEFVNSAPHNST